MGGHHMTVDEVKKHVRGYYVVFLALLCLTAVTVGLAYLHLPTHLAVIIALVVATTKGSLVSLYFMHLISEKQIIYSVLGLTAVFFVFLMAIIFYI
jgi:cytochrome c oxidase subunit 4